MTMLEGAHVLIVDDDPIGRILLQVVTESLGIRRVSQAADGLEGLALLDRGDPPDLVLLDVMMPNLDGFETCRRIRAREDLKDLPVVIQTALDSPDDRFHCFEVGATDVIAKPLHPPELRARLRVHLENRLMMRSLQQFQARVSEELRVAAAMQTSILPDVPKLAARLAGQGVLFNAYYHPCDEIGGDLWHVVPLDDRHVAVLLTDLTGHGLIAAINAFRVHGMLPFLQPHARDPGAWLAGLNQAMARDFQTQVLATGLYGLIDLEAGRFSYASAGSPTPLLGRRRDGAWTVEALRSSGMLLGMLPDTDYPVRSTSFAPGDVLFLYSDGLTLCADGYEIEVEALAAALAATTPADGQPDFARLRAALPGPAGRDDDVMMLWLARRAGSPTL